MAMNKSLWFLASIFAVLFSAAAFANYDPHTGRFLTRDPIGYADSVNLYEYVVSNPVLFYDPFGLKWIIVRDNQPTAYAMAQTGGNDTMAGLAKDIGLEANEFKYWASIVPEGTTIPDPDGQSITDENGVTITDVLFFEKFMTEQGPKPLHQIQANTKICQGGVNIPNTVIAYWAGELGNIGKEIVDWEPGKNTLYERGFMVDEKSGLTASAFESELKTKTMSKTLHGLFFWGHGYSDGGGGLLTDASQGGNLFKYGNASYYSYYSRWRLIYKPGLGILFACHTNLGRNQFSSNAIFWGKTNTLWPIGNPSQLWPLGTPTVESLIPPGAQGTRKSSSGTNP